MKRLTKDEIKFELGRPNGAEKLMDMNIDLNALYADAVELFKTEGLASSLLVRFTKKSSFIIHMLEDAELIAAIRATLRSENGKLRRNAARLMGALRLPEFVSDLTAALDHETQRYARPAMVLSLGSIGGYNAMEYLKHYHVAPSADESERKHFEEEQNALWTALRSSAPKVEHIFTGLAEEYALELRAPDLLTHQLESELDEMGVPCYDIRRSSLKVRTSDYAALFEARCFSEALFPIVSGIRLTPESAAEHAAPFMERLMRTAHTGDAPYRFRVELKIPVGNRADLIRRICMKLESAALANLPSDYEVELRIEGSMSSARLYCKLFTYNDSRFAYRAESIPASMDPSVAAAVLRFASEHLSVNARVLDPCCGSGTLLIERGLLSPCASLTGVDIAHKSIEIARRNTALSGVDAKYVVNDILRFECHRPYDELICNLPFGNRVGSHSYCERLYAGLLDKLSKLVRSGGIAILYTMEFTLLKRLIREREEKLTLLGQQRTEAGGLTPMIFIVRVG